jgi:hypothetical protein
MTAPFPWGRSFRRCGARASVLPRNGRRIAMDGPTAHARDFPLAVPPTSDQISLDIEALEIPLTEILPPNR